VATPEHVPERVAVDPGPLLQQIEVLFAGAAGQVVAATLQQKRPVGIEGDGGIGAVAFLFHYQIAPGDLTECHLREILLTWSQAGTFDVPRSGVFVQDVVGHATARLSR
jgi:hypothetical protein